MRLQLLLAPAFVGSRWELTGRARAGRSGEGNGPEQEDQDSESGEPLVSPRLGGVITASSVLCCVLLTKGGWHAPRAAGVNRFTHRGDSKINRFAVWRETVVAR